MHRSALFPLVVLLALAACTASPATPDGGVGPVPPEDDASTPSDATPPEDAAPPPSDGGTDAGPVRCGTQKLRVVAGNLSGEGATYDDGRGARIFQGLAPDVALVQELRVGDDSTAAQRAFVDAAFGAGYAFYRGTFTGRSDIPNAVVSRFPIVEAGEWADPFVQNRTFVWARIDVPGAADLYAISVHFLTTNATERAGEASSLVARVAALPPGSLVVLGGDLNTNARTEKAIENLAAAFVTGGTPPDDGAGNSNTNTPRSRPYDWVVAGAALDGCQRPVAIGARSFPSGLVFDSRVYSPLADVSPILATDSDSPLQHMAVVRDFVLPE